MYSLKGLLFCVVMALNSFAARADNLTDSLPSFTISYHNFSENISDRSYYLIDSSGTLGVADLKQKVFRKGNNRCVVDIMGKSVDRTKNLWLKFSLTNELDTAKGIICFAGFHNKVTYYFFINDTLAATRYCGWNIDESKRDMPGKKHIVNYQLKAGERVDVLCLIEPGVYIRYTSLIENYISTPEYLEKNIGFPFTFYLYNSIAAAFLGMFVILFLYILVKFIQFRTTEYLYYCIYLLFTTLFIFNLRIVLFSTDTLFFKYYLEIQSSTQYLSTAFYFLFAKAFLNVNKSDKYAYNIIRYSVYLILIIFSISIIFMASGMRYPVWVLYGIARVAMVLLSVAAIGMLFSKKSPVTPFFIGGSICLIVSYAIAFIRGILLNLKLINHPGYDHWDAILYLTAIPLGTVIEILFFTLGLSYKQKLIEQQKTIAEQALLHERELKDLEKIQTVKKSQEEERTRIAHELHDDLGSGLSTIRFLSETALAKPVNAESKTVLEKISFSSNELVDSLRHVVWTMNPEYSSLEDLLLYLKKYMGDYLELNGLDCSCQLPATIPERKMSAAERRNIFLVVKEALHNSVKHAGANRVDLSIDIGNTTTIIIRDNGKGINSANQNLSGNGMKNMKKRMQDVKGSFDVYNDAGTVVKITF